MYNLLTKIIVNSVIIIGELTNLIKQKIIFLIDFYLFVCENNPLLLDYYDREDETENDEKDVREGVPVEEGVPVKEEKFEDKYLEKFKSFPNEFFFNELELAEEQTEYEKIKTDFEEKLKDALHEE